MTATGVPDGWEAEEATDLRWRGWRFLRLVDPAQRSSISEDNLALRDGVAMPGEEGLAAFFADLCDPLAEAPAAAVVAAQVGHLVIRGSSRESSFVRVAEDPAPALERGADACALQACFIRDGYRQLLTVRAGSPGAVTAEWGATLPVRDEEAP